MPRILRLSLLALALLAPVGSATCEPKESNGGGGAGTGGTGGAGGGGSGTGGASACGSCADVYVNGGIVCGDTPSADAWQALIACGCQGTCDDDCESSFCVTSPASMACGTCLESACAAALSSCADN